MGEAAEELSLTVKCSGHADIQLQLPPSAKVQQLKQQLEQLTGIFARNQKLIYKGKVLADGAVLGPSGSGLANGAKLMLLATSAAANLRAGAPAPAPPRPRPAATAPINRAAGDAAADKFRPPAALAAAAAASSSRAAATGGPLVVGVPLAARRSNWAKLGLVALRDLGLTHLEEEVLADLPGVRAADLSHNQLPSLPTSLGACSSLSALRLSHNALTTPRVPWASLASLSSCTLLLLDHNQLDSLPAALGALPQLVLLGVGGNVLQQVEGGALPPTLQQLDLSENQLAALPEDLGGCSSLVSVNACHNSISAIPASCSRLTALQTLLLDHNRIPDLPPRLLVACSSLATLGLHSNPITVQQLRAAEGYAEYEARRQARSTKQLEARVMGVSGGRGFSEGADVEQWQHWAT